MVGALRREHHDQVERAASRRPGIGPRHVPTGHGVEHRTQQPRVRPAAMTARGRASSRSRAISSADGGPPRGLPADPRATLGERAQPQVDRAHSGVVSWASSNQAATSAFSVRLAGLVDQQDGTSSTTG